MNMSIPILVVSGQVYTVELLKRYIQECENFYFFADTHDFSKVNSVRYKIAVEISANASKQPLVILTAKDGTAVEDELTVEDVHQNYYVIKILNRNKM